jgi:hypothetical protein
MSDIYSTMRGILYVHKRLELVQMYLSSILSFNIDRLSKTSQKNRRGTELGKSRGIRLGKIRGRKSRRRNRRMKNLTRNSI